MEFHPGRGCFTEEGHSSERWFQLLKKVNLRWSERPHGGASHLRKQGASWPRAEVARGSECRSQSSVKDGCVGLNLAFSGLLLCWASQVLGSNSSFLTYKVGNLGPAHLSSLSLSFLICKMGAERKVAGNAAPSGLAQMISPAVAPGGKEQHLKGQMCVSFQRKRLREHQLTAPLQLLLTFPFLRWACGQ